MPAYHAYGRVSTAKQGKSLNDQEDLLKERWERLYKPKGFTYAGFYADEEVSGGLPLFTRKAGREMQLRMQRGDMLGVVHADRMCRSMEDWVSLTVRVLPGIGITLDVVTMGFDLATPEGALMGNMLAAFAQFNRQLIATRVRDGMQAGIRKGAFYGPIPTLGWSKAPKGKLVANHAERTYLTNVHHWVQEQKPATIKEALELLAKHEVKHPRNNRWSREGWRRIEYAIKNDWPSRPWHRRDEGAKG